MPFFLISFLAEAPIGLVAMETKNVSFSILMVCWKLRVDVHAHIWRLLAFTVLFLSYLWPVWHFPSIPCFRTAPTPPPSAAPACPLPAFPCASTSPYPSIWHSQLFKKKYQLACMKSKRERGIKGNCGNKALQKSLTSQVFPAGRLLASLGHLPSTQGPFGGGGEGMRAQLSAGVEGERSPAAPSAAVAPGHERMSLHPSHCTGFKDCWGRGGLHWNLFLYSFIQQTCPEHLICAKHCCRHWGYTMSLSSVSKKTWP